MTSPGQRKTASDTESQGTYTTAGSFEVEEFSPPESPEADISVEDHGGWFVGSSPR